MEKLRLNVSWPIEALVSVTRCPNRCFARKLTRKRATDLSRSLPVVVDVDFTSGRPVTAANYAVGYRLRLPYGAGGRSTQPFRRSAAGFSA